MTARACCDCPASISAEATRCRSCEMARRHPARPAGQNAGCDGLRDAILRLMQHRADEMGCSFVLARWRLLNPGRPDPVIA